MSKSCLPTYIFFQLLQIAGKFWCECNLYSILGTKRGTGKLCYECNNGSTVIGSKSVSYGKFWCECNYSSLLGPKVQRKPMENGGGKPKVN